MQAIDFVQMQGDDDLWELLISLALGSAESTGAWQIRVSMCDLQSMQKLEDMTIPILLGIVDWSSGWRLA